MNIKYKLFIYVVLIRAEMHTKLVKLIIFIKSGQCCFVAVLAVWEKQIFYEWPDKNSCLKLSLKSTGSCWRHGVATIWPKKYIYISSPSDFYGLLCQSVVRSLVMTLLLPEIHVLLKRERKILVKIAAVFR